MASDEFKYFDKWRKLPIDDMDHWDLPKEIKQACYHEFRYYWIHIINPLCDELRLKKAKLDFSFEHMDIDQVTSVVVAECDKYKINHDDRLEIVTRHGK